MEEHKNNSKPVSRVLFPTNRDLIIYLGLHSRAGSIDLPTDIGRAALSPAETRRCQPIWSFNS
ncbi:hypothetical protein GCM10023188_17700 [Pontibacter saemangeumensis]|uniref:Uncharacterized protein n=1 Tax=Pontibacter saemangeumensis TaxID=1084525 RepID=A0ABP8LJ78_9BACT